MTTINTRQLQQYTRLTNNNYTQDNLKLATVHMRQIRYTCTKGNAVPSQAWSGPECSRKLRFPDFVTTAQDGGKVVSLTHRPPLPQKMLLVLISVRG